MLKSTTETIAAIATPLGRGGVGIVRVSGAKVPDIAKQVLGCLPAPRYAHYGNFLGAEGQVLDQGIALYFPNPHSFTGEDVLELQGHGGPVILQWLLERVVQLGARLAEPGEFSKQAFLNDKLDLAQAEAIADLIDASSQQAAKSALRSLQGAFSNEVNTLLEQLIQLRIYVEAAIDFPEEEIDFLSDGKVAGELQSILTQLHQVLASAQQGVLLREGMSVVILGRPNAGKSSLLNALSGRESAIVTDIAGTTRDIVKEEIQVDGLPLHILDTAGLRETTDAVEQIGVARAWSALEEADRVLVVVQANESIHPEDEAILAKLPSHLPLTLIHNKVDLIEKSPGLVELDDKTEIWLSAKHHFGLDLLKDHLKKDMGYQQTAEGVFMARKRHLDALQRALDFVETGQTQLQQFAAGELLAEDLRQAQQALSEITGQFSSDDLLGRIFTSFCIGK
ncbi:MAG: tRNA uridine-5-carboxymethylaminomethyl(34) synthesis GTPase MnmE [Piscirickettsiaceae bacterium CG_4_9_14_3_um_filter_43_564]|nr:tRNA uridine-5-carboxymethylaminomethyl(34) synthesis GTPase MnmE [Thiomicrospira sp.]OIP96528.1 MAG: tRNA uridine-5-carboxymethylaminomethyl(34) synthesis GTPase MnmE [Thiomicrospira sp. CG2_30_44_34]PIQ02914.1 MAG: tRNA uridine-5-carboxymethylaminomethyl(34) synthesis GTPase MnmE [Piscirickettsiaceae bacterium CG18_big_fil_WC_8_21_14_2_50_44_103]PIU38944.1 MAG: tRNA uridine-5-carboxymethylaminomethyl(34) synthesis GTPase MnmE [Piscirickettsiaceae bacterium CG07_land_8_20_14_0_80_44_28]PIW5